MIQEHPTAAGAGTVRYHDDEILVRTADAVEVENVLTAYGRIVARTEVTPAFRRYRFADVSLDLVLELLGPLARRNHVLSGAPFQHGGLPDPGDPPPQPTPVPTVPTVPVAVLDGDATGTHATTVATVVRGRTDAADVHVVALLNKLGRCSEADLAAALCRLEPQVRVVNLSLGGYTADGLASPVLRDALGRALDDPRRLVVAAAGNDGNSADPFWPAAFAGSDAPWSDRVVAVAAHDGRAAYPWSNSGSWVTVAAPGAGEDWSGTSFATPWVTGELVRHLADGCAVDEALARVLSDGTSEVVDPKDLG